MNDHSRTIRKLSEITDAGLFERLATAVLRQAKPETYGNLSHPGMNPGGKTVKSPLDGIAFTPDAEPPHMVAAHHATVKDGDLTGKWLHDPANVRPRKGRPTQPPGDVVKTMGIVEQERKRTPGLRFTLALTTNREPSADLVRDVQAEARRHGIAIDVWSVSRIAHYLDFNPSGQTIRREYLGFEQKLLSADLLGSLSRSSLSLIPLMVDRESLINRELDAALERSPRPVAFLIGGSGFGKSVACFKRLSDHIEGGGFGLVLTHEVLNACRTLDEALDTQLRKLCPELEADAGAKARAFSSPECPFLVVIEDINKADSPARLLERVASWLPTESKSAGDDNCHILCPVWPRFLATTTDEVRKRVDTSTFTIAPYTAGDARAAIRIRAKSSKTAISPLDEEKLAASLGNDPLLFALYDFERPTEPNRVVAGFISRSLQRLSANSNALTAPEYRSALNGLGLAMMRHRRIEPTWAELSSWMSESSQQLSAIRHLIHEGEVARLSGESSDRIEFRHDRVRDRILVEAAIDAMERGGESDGVFSEPFFSEVVGTALTEAKNSVELVAGVQVRNPLALFYALKVFRNPSNDGHRAVLDAIDRLLADEATHGRANQALRLEALQVLSDTESPHVIPITDKFRSRNSWPYLSARFRNGDVSAGLSIVLRMEPGVTSPWRDLQVAHAKLRFGDKLRDALSQALSTPDLSGSLRSGGLRLAGYMADSSLSSAIAACWASDSEKAERLTDYIWAGAQCCGDNPAVLLDPACDAWAALPDKSEKEGLPSPRDDLAAHHLAWAFNESLSISALHYFIERAKRDDLRWPITYMLRGVDHPDAVDFLARDLGNRARQAESSGGFSIFWDHVPSDWTRRQREKGKAMSPDSRERLKGIWTSSLSDRHFRRAAFALWAATTSANDLRDLREAQSTDDLSKDVLMARLKRGDSEAIPQLVEQLEIDKKGYWWQAGRHIWSPQLTNALDAALDKRGSEVRRSWDGSWPNDWITRDVFMRLEPETAEQLLSKHWEHLRFSSDFIQAALYVGTSKTRQLAAEAISEAPDKAKIFEHIFMHFGIKTTGHPGVTELRRLESLVPYLDLLTPFTVFELWDFCNERGWIDFRRAHFDQRLSGEWRKRARFDDQDVIAEIDEGLAKGGIGWDYFWMEHHLEKRGASEKVFELLKKWLSARRSLAAFEFVSQAVARFGRRSDFDLLAMDGIEPASEVEAIRKDAIYAVMRRSLD